MSKIKPTYANHPAHKQPRGYYICAIGTDIYENWSRIYQSYKVRIRVRNILSKTNDFVDCLTSVGKDRKITQKQFIDAINFAKKSKRISQ